MALLTVNNLTKNFGGLAAVSHVSMSVEENELIGLIGPNGAGKTTLFNLLLTETSDSPIFFENSACVPNFSFIRPLSFL